MRKNRVLPKHPRLPWFEDRRPAVLKTGPFHLSLPARFEPVSFSFGREGRLWLRLLICGYNRVQVWEVHFLHLKETFSARWC